MCALIEPPRHMQLLVTLRFSAIGHRMSRAPIVVDFARSRAAMEFEGVDGCGIAGLVAITAALYV